jgi:hypothetical protein
VSATDTRFILRGTARADKLPWPTQASHPYRRFSGDLVRIHSREQVMQVVLQTALASYDCRL